MQPGSPFLGDVAEGALGATEISGGRGVGEWEERVESGPGTPGQGQVWER